MDRRKLIEQLRLHEGVRSKPYHCTADKLTIGVGRNLDDVGLSEDEINYLLNNDIDRCTKELRHEFPFFNKLSDNRKMVLVDMCFNLGLTRLSKFVNTLKFIEQGEYEKASENMLKSLWAKQVGGRAIRLSQMMKEG
jgi:lysozyme